MRRFRNSVNERLQTDKRILSFLRLIWHGSSDFFRILSPVIFGSCSWHDQLRRSRNRLRPLKHSAADKYIPIHDKDLPREHSFPVSEVFRINSYFIIVIILCCPLLESKINTSLPEQDRLVWHLPSAFYPKLCEVKYHFLHVCDYLRETFLPFQLPRLQI